MAMSILEQLEIGLSETQQFKPYLTESTNGDAITLRFKGVPDYSERLNDFVTLYLSREDDTIVGCRIKCIREVLQELPQTIDVKHQGNRLQLFFSACRIKATTIAEKVLFAELGKEASKIHGAEEATAC